jgi:hypothetical protein
VDRWLLRRVGIVGIAFVVVFVVSSFLAPSTPNSHASVAKVVSFYHKHRGVIAAQAWVIEVAILVGVFFFWYLREYLGRTEGSRRLATVGFAGALLFAVSGGLSAGINFALADSINHVSGTTIQTLSVLQNDFSVFMGGAGVGIFLIASGIVCIASGLIARWVGWVGVVLAVVSLALPFFAPPAAGLWVLIASIVIIVKGRRGGAEPSDVPASATGEALA